MSVSVSRTGDSELMNPPVIGAASASSRPPDDDTHHFSAAPDLGHHPEGVSSGGAARDRASRETGVTLEWAITKTPAARQTRRNARNLLTSKTAGCGGRCSDWRAG